MTKEEKIKKEIEEIRANPEKYLKTRSVKLNLLGYVISVVVAFAVGAIFF